jgi:small subunit ribosomal protein S24e
MKIEISNEKQNAMLHRRELTLTITECRATPARKDVLAAVAAQLSVPEGNIVLDRMDQDFGSKTVRAYVKAYEDEKFKNMYSLKYKEARGKPKAEKAEEEKKEEKK